MNNYTFYLPENPIIIKVNEPVEFIVTSKDVTYGFGVFRADGTMVFQMQVIPWYNNSIIWIFDEPGNYTIRSTEYSGPEHPYMVIPNAIRVMP
jgi:cytochrome c oxidase subunit 2